jgi:hypothetical protein
MLKIISPSGWDFGAPLSSTIKKTASGRLTGQDFYDLVKVAGHQFAHEIKQADLLPGEHPVHLIAMGATEFYGNNRNGDGFKAAMLRKCHPSFVKSAKHYRHHQHNDPSTSFGRVIKSAFNEDMKRVELLVGLNETKEAADRNGGLVADFEMKKIANGEDIPFSMAIHVPYDVCASCDNRAKTRSNYCTEDSCISPEGIKRGGCKTNLAKVAFDGFVNHVDNPEGEFFDISTVIVPAEPTAYGGSADYLMKVASGTVHYGGAELAELMNVVEPLDFRLRNIFNKKTATLLKAAYLLKEAEKAVTFSEGRELRAVKAASSRINVRELGSVGSATFKENLTKLARQNICLTPVEFLEVVDHSLPGSGIDKLSNDFESALPGVFGRLAAVQNLENFVDNHDMCVDINSDFSNDTVSNGLYSERSFNKDAVDRRVVGSFIRGEGDQKIRQTKSASTLNSRAEALAKMYALYKVSHLSAQPEEDRQRTARLLVCQNVTCDSN